jgi:hypothetical protein
MDQLLQTIITLITLSVGVLGLYLNYAKRNDEQKHTMTLDISTDYTRLKKERDDLLAEKERWAIEKDTLQEEILKRDQALARIAIQSIALPAVNLQK